MDWQLEKCFYEAELGEEMNHLTLLHSPLGAGRGWWWLAVTESWDGCHRAREESLSKDLGSIVGLFLENTETEVLADAIWRSVSFFTLSTPFS